MDGDHYFSPSPTGAAEHRLLRVRLPGLPGADARGAEVVSAGGTFSAGRLDPGTAVLLDHAGDPPVTGDLLDLGCGWGPIALSMAARAPRATVWAVDVNERARALAALNAERLDLPGVRVAAPAGVPSDVSFSAIWSNPPIRIGKDALHDLLGTWLARLRPDGEALLVVSKNLGADSLARWLGEVGWSVTRTASSRGYRVLRVVR